MTKTARLYGGGLYDLALEEKLTDTILQQLSCVRELMKENPDYAKLLAEPSIPFAKRCEMIDEAFGAAMEKYVVNFIKLLCERGILGEYGMCCDEYTRRYDIDNGIAVAYVTGAAPLTEDQKKSLTGKLEAKSGKRIRLKEKVDPHVVAGLRVELDGVEMDGTVQARLDTLSRKLNEITV